uniref:Replication termination factor 2 n=1 Tax=Acanthochromis polyacanthus TaxID=80966 RepID=A0A3Q1GDQ4_9TELE
MDSNSCQIGLNNEIIQQHRLIAFSVCRHIMMKNPVLFFLQDIKELNLTDNPEWEGERRNAKGDRYEDIHCGMFICPVVGLEMNGKHRFCYLQTCGCVFSDRALKEVKTEICHKCGDPFKHEDIVVLNGTKEEVEKLMDRMVERRAKAKTKVGFNSNHCMISNKAGTVPGCGPCVYEC